MYRFPSAAREQTEASTVHTSPVCMPTCRETSGTQLEVRRNTNKTSKKHATAVVDDVRGTLRHVNKERSDEKRPQDPESTPSCRKLYKFFQKPTWMMQNMYP